MPRSPLLQGAPFVFLMVVGTYALSLYTQAKYDFVVRAPLQSLWHCGPFLAHTGAIDERWKLPLRLGAVWRRVLACWLDASCQCLHRWQSPAQQHHRPLHAGTRQCLHPDIFRSRYARMPLIGRSFRLVHIALADP